MTYISIIEISDICHKHNCSICQQKLQFYQTKYITKCRHKYHLKCAKKWFYKNDNKTCPNCRESEKWKNPNVFLHISGY